MVLLWKIPKFEFKHFKIEKLRNKRSAIQALKITLKNLFWYYIFRRAIVAISVFAERVNAKVNYLFSSSVFMFVIYTELFIQSLEYCSFMFLKGQNKILRGYFFLGQFLLGGWRCLHLQKLLTFPGNQIRSCS